MMNNPLLQGLKRVLPNKTPLIKLIFLDCRLILVADLPIFKKNW